MIPSAPVVRAAVRLLGVVPAPPVRWLARAVGSAGFALARGRRKTLLENMRYLSPNRSPRERRALARRAMANLLDAAVDLYRLPSMTPADLGRLITVEGREHVDAAIAMGRGVIAVTPHLGPYELGGAWMAMAGYPVHAMVEEIDPETNAALALYREATGMKLIPRSAGFRGALRLLRERQVVLLVADRVVGGGGDGVEVAFGDGRRHVPAGPAALALATGAPIIAGYIVRNPARSSRYLVHLDPPIVAAGPGDGPHDREALTRLLAARMADAVQAYPDQWFVFQPQWLQRDAPPRD